MASNSEVMAAIFNKALGDKTGRRMDPNRLVQYSNDPAIQSYVMSLAKDPSAAFKTKKVSSVSKSKYKKAKAPTQKQIANKLKADLEGKIAIKGKSAKKHKSIFEKVAGGVGHAVDVVSRPGYAVDELLNNVTKSINSGEPIWSLGDDAVSGAVKGLWGTKKTSFGDVMETAKQGMGTNSRFMKEILPFGMNKNNLAKGLLTAFPVGGQLLAPTMYGPNLKKFEDKHPGFAKWEKPIVDIAGSLATDPTTYVGPGLLTKLGSARFAENAFVKTAIATGRAADTPAAKALFKAETAATKAKQFAEDVKRAQAAGHSIKKATKLAEKAAKTRNLPAEMAKQQLKDSIERKLRQVIPQKVGAKVANFPDAESLTGTSFQKFLKHMVNQGGESVDNFTANVHGGAALNKGIHGSEAADAIASDISVKYRDFRYKSLQPKLDRIKKSHLGIGKKMTTSEIKKMIDSEPLMEEYFKSAEKQMAESGLKVTTESIHDQAARDMIAVLDKHVKTDIKDELLGVIGQQTHHTPLIRNLQAGGKIAERLGNGAAHVADLYDTSLLAKGFSYKKNFPGFTSMIASHVRSKGVARFEDFYKEVTDFAKAGKYTKAERKLADEALTGKYELTGHAETLRKFLQEKYAGIRDEEVKYGSRLASSPEADNYTFNFIKNGGKQKEKTAVNKFVSDTVKRTGSMPSKQDIIDQFPNANLRFDTDGVRALLLRHKKMIRDQARMGFNDDLVHEYHVVAKNMSEDAAKNLNLVKVKPDSISLELRDALKPGESYYLPQQIHDTRKVFQEMTGMAQGNEVGNALLRSVDTVTKHFKTLSTVYYPSYHIRNMLGDMYFGALDGVKPHEYLQVLNAKKNGGAALVKIGDESWPMSRVEKLYEQASKASGFMPTELPHTVSPHRITQTAQKIGEKREDLGRLVHFKHAMDQEYEAVKHAYPGKVKLLENGSMTQKKDARAFLEHKADLAARARVNKYKFDYSALTPFEQNYMKRVIPFYTYMRKAAPTMVESMFLNPRVLNNTNRILNQFEPEGGFNDLIAPEWMRAVGYSVLPGEMHQTEPWVFRHDVMPTSLLNDYTQQGDSENLTSSVLGNFGSRLNPVALAPLQAMIGKQLFSGKKVENLPDAILSSLRPWNTAMEAKNSNKSGMEQLIHLSGLPFQPIRKGSQSQYIAEVKTVNQRISRLGFKIYLSGGTYHLQDKETGKTLKTGHSMADVLPAELHQTSGSGKKKKDVQTFVGKDSLKEYQGKVKALSGTKASDLKKQLKDLQDKIDAMK